MEIGRFVRRASFSSALCCAMLCPGRASTAATFLEFVDPHAASGNQFGATVVPLSGGNVVVTSPFDDAGGTDAGAVYLFNGATGALISTLRGSTAGNNVGSGGVTALTNGNYVVRSPNWDDGATTNVGAATWGSGATGASGAVSATNSLIGSAANDNVTGGGVTALTNGNYVVGSPVWDNGGATNAGAATWGSGATGATGAVSAANSLVGSAANDQVGSITVTALTNGNYVVMSPSWDNGAAINSGAATWGNGTTGVSGTVSAANSLVGTTANDAIGSFLEPLTNGNYVVYSSAWDNGAVANVGAATWGNGTTGVSGVVSAANSLIGSTAADQVGGSSVFALTNGNYVVASQSWDNGAAANAGAVTWGSGTTGVSGVVSAANSLVGSTANDNVPGFVRALTNGNYVVVSSNWDNGATIDVGAATWGGGATGVNGPVSAANSLVGSTANDNVGSGAVRQLTNGDYVVASPNWDNGAAINVGAATWGSGTSGVTGSVSAANSLVGSTANDNVSSGGALALTNGNYVVLSPAWDNGATSNVGAATWGSGATGVNGAVSAANSLVGSTVNDNVGNGVAALTNANYVILSRFWDNGAAIDAGAATWGSGATGVSGPVSASNSLVGSTTNDNIGSGSVRPLTNGNYVVASANWDNGVAIDVGAATWGSGTSGVSGVVSAANSLVGSTSGDGVSGVAITALSDGSYVVANPKWDNGAIDEAGSATWGSGTTGVSGEISAANSLVGTASDSTGLASIVGDGVNNVFYARFVIEVGGRVRVGPANHAPAIVSAADILNDQGGWLRLTFNRSPIDNATNSTAPVAWYGAWRHVPGTLVAAAARPNPGAARSSLLDAQGVERGRTMLKQALGLREVEGRFYITGGGSRASEMAATFPPGTWELVVNVPALQQAQYLVAVPTISNAAPNDFVITAHTTLPSMWFVSAPASGQSVDNLAPAQPTSLTAAYSAGQTNLLWAPNSENDLGSYHIHRGASADFTPGIGNLIATQISTNYSDIGPAGSCYKVSAVDVNGNQSGFALVTPNQTTEVEAGGSVAFALEPLVPNPAKRNQLNVAFALPVRATARLDLVDVGGRRVVSREVGALGAGRHTVNLSEGHSVASGVYWVRLTQGANRQETRVAVIQ